MEQRKDESRLSESGYSMVGVMIFIFVIVISGMSFFAMSAHESSSAIYRQETTEAFYLADAAIERARAKFLEDRAWRDGWTDDPQTVEFCFPFALENPTYRYDGPGAILRAGPKGAGGDDLPGANPELYAGLTFAAATGNGHTALVLGPDALLWRFGADSDARITSMPMMNLTGNDHQFGQGGWRNWTFRYRIVLLDTEFHPVQAIQEAQQFETAPFVQAPGQAPAVPGLEPLDIDFSGGPLLAFKTAEDGQRLILRFWNVTDRPADGSLQLPPGWARAELCDALERPQKPLDITGGRAHFTADPRAIATLALRNDR